RVRSNLLPVRHHRLPGGGGYFSNPSVRGSHSPGVHLAHSIQTGSAQGNEGEYHWQPEFAGGGEAIPCKEDDLCQFGQRLRHAASLELRIRGPTSRAGRCVRRCETICGTEERGRISEPEHKGESRNGLCKRRSQNN